MNEKDILETVYSFTIDKLENDQVVDIPNSVKDNVDYMISKIGSNKSIVSALVTSLVKKIKDADQDIRLHRTDFQGGYSARSLDTKFTSPFFKRHFPKYANKESSFLTLATREKIKWTKEDGINLKIRNKKLKASFLNIFENVETGKIKPHTYLTYIFLKLIDLSKTDEQIFNIAENIDIKTSTLNINIILEILEKHFSNKLSSRLPVIAIYSIYELLLPVLSRYDNKKLLDLESHTSSDKHSFGDIEIYDNDNNPFEIVEIKHQIPITKDLIFDIVKKTENTAINKYYILTTYKGGFKDIESEKRINNFLLKIKIGRNIDIIANGIIATMKYYLRFIDDYNLFLKTYTKNLIQDAKQSTEIKNFHIESWTEILNEYNID